MITLVVETGAGLANANSYCDKSTANAFHEIEGNEAWNNANDADKDRALIRATRYLDTYSDYPGYPTTNAQGLLWPREGVFNTQLGEEYAANVVPNPLRYAVAELAAWLVAGNNLENSAGGEVTNVDVEGLSVSVAPGNSTSNPLPRRVLDMLSRWGLCRRNNSAGIIRV